MREYAITRNTAEWRRIVHALRGGLDPQCVAERDSLIADIEQTLRHDDDGAVALPASVVNPNAPAIVEWHEPDGVGYLAELKRRIQ